MNAADGPLQLKAQNIKFRDVAKSGLKDLNQEIQQLTKGVLCVCCLLLCSKTITKVVGSPLARWSSGEPSGPRRSFKEG